ncbi:MAG TPA: hypothetical protein VF331_01695 [Polyangiales bacterium]
MAGFAGAQSGASGSSGATAGNGTNGGTSAAAGSGAGTGGATGTGGMMAGTGGMMAGTGGAGPTGPVGGAYLTSGAWHGYAWTNAAGTGSTIMPKDFSARAAGAPYCVSGTVGASTDFSGLALLGVNLNQAQTGVNPPLMSVTPTSAGLNINVMNKGTSPLRVQIQGPMGATVATDRWCAPVVGSGGFIPWTSFNTKCWDASGTAYAKQPLQQVQVMVPGGMTAPIAFDFCLVSIGEADGPGMGTAGTGGSGGSGGSLSTGVNGGSGMITDGTGSAQVTRDGRNYVVQNNVWGANAAQTLSYNGPSFEVKAQSGNNGGGGQPVSYPSAFIGSNYGRGTSGSNLPKQVSAIQSVQTGFSHNADGAISGQYNATYDVWFSTNAGGDTQAPSGGYLMVWLFDPSNEQPMGSVVQAGATVAGMPGTWDVWQGTNSGKPCISYVRTQPTTSIEFDLNLFIKDATTRPSAPIQSNWYLSNVFAGFEIWSGGVGLKCNAFYAIVN